MLGAGGLNGPAENLGNNYDERVQRERSDTCRILKIHELLNLLVAFHTILEKL